MAGRTENSGASVKVYMSLETIGIIELLANNTGKGKGKIIEELLKESHKFQEIKNRIKNSLK